MGGTAKYKVFLHDLGLVPLTSNLYETLELAVMILLKFRNSAIEFDGSFFVKAPSFEAREAHRY